LDTPILSTILISKKWHGDGMKLNRKAASFPEVQNIDERTNKKQVLT
jgi:hypothetical protein